MTIQEFRKATEAVILKTYGLGVGDADLADGWIENAIECEETPEDLAKWWGDKYDLDPVDPDGRIAWGLGPRKEDA